MIRDKPNKILITRSRMGSFLVVSTQQEGEKTYGKNYFTFSKRFFF